MSVKRKNYKKSAFSLIELIIVMAIIVILTAIMLPAFAGYKNNAIMSKGLSDGKTVVDAYESYCAINNEELKEDTVTVSSAVNMEEVKNMIGNGDFGGIGSLTLSQVKSVIAGEKKFSVENGKITGVK